MRALIAGVALLCAACATANGAAVERPPAAVLQMQVRENGLVASYFRPSGDGTFPGIVVLGGSEGGIEGAESLARPLAEQGYATLAVAFFGADGVPAHLQDVPLSYFDHAFAWLKAAQGVDPRHVGIIGASKGGEAVLLVAARRHDLAAVVAGVPSDVAWQGINREDRTPRSSWSDENGPLAYAPYDRTRPFTTVYALYEGGRAQYGDTGEALIHVDRISAPLLLIAGENDALWPSADMTRRIEARLAAAHFHHNLEVEIYANAGHGIIGAPVTLERAQTFTELGGTPEGNGAARADAWARILAFFDRELR
jgi:uncharacterized protein